MIACSGDTSPSAAYAREVEAALASNDHLGAERVVVDGQRVVIEFGESDFAIRFSEAGENGGFLLRITAAVRAQDPSLDTWWAQWSVPAPRGATADLAIQEVAASRARFQRMLQEKFRRRA